MGSFTLDGRQPGQLTKMFLILLASTLLHLCRGHSLGTDLHMSQHGAEDNQRVEYDLITKAVTFETPKDNDIMASSAIDDKPTFSADPARLSSDSTRVKRTSSCRESSRCRRVGGKWTCTRCCIGRWAGGSAPSFMNLCACDSIIDARTFASCKYFESMLEFYNSL